MLKKRAKCFSLFFLILILCFVTIFGNPINGQASSPQDTYYTDLKVGLTSIGNLSDLKFSVNDDYLLVDQGILLKKANNYEIIFVNGSYSIYENSLLIQKSTGDINIKPLNVNSLITINISIGYSRSYKGSIVLNKIDLNKFMLINSVNIEDYLVGVVPYEMDESFPAEALKAQAVAARTYALFNKGSSSNFDVTDGTGSQVYLGYDASKVNSIDAIQKTKGEVITYNGQLIDAVFSASDGGYTEASENVWLTPLPYLAEKSDPYDVKYNTSSTFSTPQLDAIIKQKHPEWNVKNFVRIDVNVSNIKTYGSGRIASLPLIFIDNNNMQQVKTIGKEEARTFFNVKSALYTVSYDEGTDIYTFNVKGYGHGLGLSQWGAYYRAKAGVSFKDILNFYYSNVSIQNISSGNTIASFIRYIGGNNRYETAISIADKTFNPTVDNKIKNVVVATANNFPDALAGASLAKSVNAPILLVDSAVNSPKNTNVFNYIDTNVDKAGKVYILGQTGVISSDFNKKFAALGFNNNNIIRLGGSTRIQTAEIIDRQLNAGATVPIIISTADNFPDALSISPIAAKNGWPIFLISGVMSDNLQKYITSKQPSKVYIVGGTGVVSDTIKNKVESLLRCDDRRVIRLGGDTRYDTSKIINSTFLPNSAKVTLVTGKDFPDALAGSIYSAVNSLPIMLADSNNCLNAAAYLKFLNSNNGSRISLEAFGLSGAVDENTIKKLTNIVR